MLLDEIYRESCRKLPGRAREILLLICTVFGISQESFWAGKNDCPPDPASLLRWQNLLERLARGEPLAYLTGTREFFSLPFTVDRRVLIPRPESELLVEKALAACRPGDLVLDIGSGSGCLALALAANAPVRVLALEKDPRAREVLKHNIRSLGLEKRVSTVAGDLFPRRRTAFNLILANPPYLSEKEWAACEPGVRDFEPRQALVAGPGGLEIIAAIISRAGAFLAAGGRLLLEFGSGQQAAVASLLADQGFNDVSFSKDLQGITRMVEAAR